MIRDPAALIAAAAANPAISDRAMRVYTVMVTVFDRGADAATIAAALPNVADTEQQAAKLLGGLVGAGLLAVRRRVVGYDGPNRIRRRFYTLAGGEHA